MNLNKAFAADGELAELILSKAEHWYQKAERDRFDLFPFFCILASTGWNKNTDIFDPKELWAARKSPTNKPVNIGHIATKIRGHIVDCIAVGEDLQPIPDDTKEDDLPDKFHIVLACVLYKYYDDADAQAEINQIIDKVAKGDTFVSMECLFKNFDYGLMDAQGSEKRITRNSQTSNLTKYLRQYKGPGKIHGYTIGRVLKDLTFSAVGIVDKPANPDSIISSRLDIFSNKTQASASEPVYINIDCPNNTEKTMSDINIKDSAEYKALEASYASLKTEFDLFKKNSDVADLQKTLASVENELKDVKASKDEKDKKDAKDLEDAKSTIATLTSENETLKSTVASLESAKAELATANDAMNETITEFKKATRHSERAEAMMAADSTLTREAALASAAKYDELSDASFAAMVEMLKGYASRAPKEVTAESVLATAKAEKEAQYGAIAESQIETTTAAIKEWYSNTKGTKKES